MPETSSPATQSDEVTPSPSSVGNSFMRQYYHFLAKEPQSLHRFYKAESRWCHGLGSHMEEPIAGQRAINDQILKRGYAGARVDLDAGSIDCQNSLGGGVLVLVTGVMTLHSSPEPKPFVQTFFLAVQPKGYFVLNDCLRFLELPGLSNEEVDKEKNRVSENGKKTEVQTPTSPVKPVQLDKTKKGDDNQQETPVPASPKKEPSPIKTVAKTMTTPTTKKVLKEETPISPVKATATVASSPVKKTTTTTTKTKEHDEVPTTTPSPVPSPVKKQVKTAAAVVAPAEPVVSAPVEPEKPKTWAALFSSTATTITAAAPLAAASARPASPKATAASASTPVPVISPTSSSPTPEKSPKNKMGNGKEKEKEHKRLYSLFIRELPPQTRENDLRELFKGYGPIAGVNVVPQRNYAFVDYFEQESMRAALAETKEFKLLDKVLQVSERGDRKDGQRGGFRSNDSRGRGRGHGPKSGRGDRGDRKERNGDDAPSSNKGERREGSRREKTGSRRGGKVDATSHNRAD